MLTVCFTLFRVILIVTCPIDEFIESLYALIEHFCWRKFTLEWEIEVWSFCNILSTKMSKVTYAGFVERVIKSKCYDIAHALSRFSYTLNSTDDIHLKTAVYRIALANSQLSNMIFWSWVHRASKFHRSIIFEYVNLNIIQ